MLYEHKLETRTRGLVCGNTYASNSVLLLNSTKINSRGHMWYTERPVVWAPWTLHYTVNIKARETGEIIWNRSFATRQEAIFAYINLISISPYEQIKPDFRLPPVWLEDDLVFYIAVVSTFNSSVNNSSLDWGAGGSVCPSGVSATDYLYMGGGGGGGNTIGGGGGAGGKVEATAAAVTGGVNYPITVGALGAGSTSISSPGTAGGNTSVSGLGSTASGGAGGLSFSSSGSNGGCGGGGSGSSPTNGTLGSQGGNGGQGNTNDGGGGGGVSGNGANYGGPPNGGIGYTWSPTGLKYGGGGGGGARNGSATPGNGTDGGGNGGASGAGSAATGTNRGCGGGGGGFSGASFNGGAGSAGVVVFSYTSGPVVGADITGSTSVMSMQ